MIVPIQIAPEITPDEVEELSLKALSINEAALEEFVRKNVEYLFPEGEETLIIVGQQPRNKAGGRADLVALDGNGNIVLIELKRDAEDIVARREAFEFQAIRYAANYAKIRTTQDLVQKLFAPYVERHKDEFDLSSRTPTELAAKLLNEFLSENKIEQVFNQRQRIILMASSFDAQTLSACAWLAMNGIDIKCLALTPLRYGPQHFFQIEQIIPPPKLDEYFVEIAESRESGAPPSSEKSRFGRESLPKMAKLFEWGLVKSGDEIHIRGHETRVALMRNGKSLTYEGKAMGYNAWGQLITGWSAINVYEWTVHRPSGKTLDVLRREKLAEFEEKLEQTEAKAALNEIHPEPPPNSLPG